MGAIYALIALGYTMVYGVLRLINFAHGEVFMTGSYAGIFVAMWLHHAAGGGGHDAAASMHLHPAQTLLVFGLTMLLGAMLGAGIERFAYRPLGRSAPKWAPLITAIGVSILLQNLAVLVVSATPRTFPRLFAETRHELGGVMITNVRLIIVCVAVALMAALHMLVHHTWMGKAMRATSLNSWAARLMGIQVHRVIAGTFAIGSALAAAGGILFGLDQGRIDPFIGVMVGLKAFIAAVLGGIGNIGGAMLGGVLIGLTEQLTAAYLSADYRDAITFLVLIGVLLVRPEGIMGAVQAEKV